MTDPLRARLLAAYAGEHRDHLVALRDALATGGGNIEEAYRHAHSLKGAARAVDLGPVVDLAHQLESLLEEWWESGIAPSPEALEQARSTLDDIEDRSAAVLGGGERPATPDQTVEVSLQTVRVEAETLDRVVLTVARLLAELERLQAGGERVRQAALGRDRQSGRLAEMLRLQEECEWALARSADELAGDVARLRLVTAEAALGGFGPMLRMLAAEQGKDVRYDVSGLDTQADRDVLTTAAEAVMHLLRNAVAHGIEPPARRAAAGKDPVGHLMLAVSSSGPRLEIRVSDDGAGIPIARLAEEAAARGLLTPEQAAAAGPDRLRQLVFHPGLSTAEQLSTTAGRGMGMAIVRRLVERLQGRIDLRGRPGGGTEAIIRMPVSVMAQRVVLVLVGEQLFAVPASAVMRLAQAPRSAVVLVEGRSMAALDGGEFPLIDLPAVMGTDGGQVGGEILHLVVMRVGEEAMALMVDGLADVRDLWVSPLEPELLDDPRLAGTVTLEGGILVPVLSPAGLSTTAAAKVAQAPLRPPPKVLVVDDSPTIRTLERTILEAHSYQVEVAVDGRDALERMARRRPDLVVSDIEMPRLDGFGLLAAMRADSNFASVPVVLLSSRAEDTYRRAALERGAAAYLVKTRFDQREYLDTVGRLTA